MSAKLLFIGIDVDDKSFHAYVLPEGADEGFAVRSRPSAGALLKKLETYSGSGSTLRFCYESTYSGFHLCRELRRAGHECEVIAAGLIPEMASDRVKNDRLDAKKLAIYFSKGLLTAVHVPTEEDEFDRALLRSRSFMNEQLKGMKRHLVSLCKQLGWHYREELGVANANYWTGKHRKWLDEKIALAPESVRMNFHILLAQASAIEARLQEYDQEIQKRAEAEKYERRVRALICYRGIDVLSAMTLITEIGDIRRFSHPKRLASYVGFDITEYSSGGRERRYAITKMGNRRLRTTLVESSQTYRQRPGIGRFLEKRREGIEPPFVEIADRCMSRLYRRACHLSIRGKPTNKIKVACAREMIGFIWESLNKAS